MVFKNGLHEKKTHLKTLNLISYINAYIWDLEKWFRWSYLQSRNRDIDIEDKGMDTKGWVGGGRKWESGIDIYTLLILCITYLTNENLVYSTGNSTQCFVLTYMGRKSKKRGDICIPEADSLCCRAESNITL